MSREELSRIEHGRDKPMRPRSRRKMIAVDKPTHDALTREVIRQRRKLGVRVSMGEAVALAVNAKRNGIAVGK